MKQWIVVFTLANVFQVFRLVDEKPDARVLRYASMVFDATEINHEFILKDRYGMFTPEIHPIVSNSHIHMYISNILDKPDGMGIIFGERR